MLYTLNALSTLQDNANIVLTQQHYTIFDSRNFKSDKSIEDTFNKICSDFFTTWNNTIKPFLDAIINGHDIYKVNPLRPITLIPEEGIYLKLQGIESKNIEYFFSVHNPIGNVRLIGIDNTNTNQDSSFSIFDSPVYDPLHKEFYRPITMVFYKKTFQDHKDELNDILLRLVNYVVLNFIDNRLSAENNVSINRILVNVNEDANKDAIILPEYLNITDTRFIFSYFYSLFRCLQGVLNEDILSSFIDYSAVIKLPDIFNFNMTDEEAAHAQEKMQSMTEEEANLYAMGFKYKVYSKIWDLVKKYGSHPVSDDEYIDTCTMIMGNILINIDTSYYEAEQEYHEQFESEDEESNEEGEES